MEGNKKKTRIVIALMLVGIVIGAAMIIIGAIMDSHKNYGWDWLIVGIVLVEYSIVFGVCWLIINKYNAPKGLFWLALANIYGVVALLILVYRPNGFAARSKMINCPHCGGKISPEFIICPYCHHETRAETDTTDANVSPENRIYCKKCGKANDEDAVFCKSCGAELHHSLKID